VLEYVPTVGGVDPFVWMRVVGYAVAVAYLWLVTVHMRNWW
jgi:hypothetical protein